MLSSYLILYTSVCVCVCVCVFVCVYGLVSGCLGVLWKVREYLIELQSATILCVYELFM